MTSTSIRAASIVAASFGAVAIFAACTSMGSGSSSAPTPNYSVDAGRAEPGSARRSRRRQHRLGDDRRPGAPHHSTKAAEAGWNIKLVSNTPSTGHFHGVTNSDLAFTRQLRDSGQLQRLPGVGHLEPGPARRCATAYLLPGVAERRVGLQEPAVRVGRGSDGPPRLRREGFPDSVRVSNDARARHPHLRRHRHRASEVHHERADLPRLAHAHGASCRPSDNPDNIYVYISGSSGVRPEEELTGCDKMAPDSATRTRTRKLPHRSHQGAGRASGAGGRRELSRTSSRISSPAPAATRRATSRIRRDRAIAAAAAEAARLARGEPVQARSRWSRRWRGNRPPSGPTQCHDITVYPAIGLAGGACGGYGLLLDIRDPANPKRIGAVGGLELLVLALGDVQQRRHQGAVLRRVGRWFRAALPRRRTRREWGADAIFTIAEQQAGVQELLQDARGADDERELRRAQRFADSDSRAATSWCRRGIRAASRCSTGPMRRTRRRSRSSIAVRSTRPTWSSGGSGRRTGTTARSSSSEIARGLDIFELQPSAFLSQNEIDAAKSVHFDYLNAQEQPKIVWPATFSLSRAYLDQLERNGGQSADKIAAARTGLANAEKLSGSGAEGCAGGAGEDAPRRCAGGEGCAEGARWRSRWATWLTQRSSRRERRAQGRSRGKSEERVPANFRGPLFFKAL